MKKNIDLLNQKEILDVSSEKNRNLLVVFLLFFIYLTISLLTISDIDYYVPNALIKLPLLSVELPVYYFLILSASLLLIMHGNILWNLTFHLEKLKKYEMSQDIKSYHLFPYVFNFIKNGYILFFLVMIFPIIIFSMLLYKSLFFHDNNILIIVLGIFYLDILITCLFVKKIQNFYKIKILLALIFLHFLFFISVTILGFKYLNDSFITGKRLSPIAGLEERLHYKGAHIVKPKIHKYAFGLDLSHKVLLKKQLSESLKIKLIEFNKTKQDNIFLDKVDGYSIKSRKFRYATFSNSILTKTKFDDVSFEDIDFRDIDGRKSIFLNTKINKCKFQGSRLDYSTFDSSYIDNTIFGNMTYTTFKYVKFNKFTKSEDEYLSAIAEYGEDIADVLGSRKMRIYTNRTIFDGNLSYSNFEYSNIVNIVGSTTMTNIRFWKSRLENSIFESSDIKKAFFFFTAVVDSVFKDVDFRGTLFNGGKFTNCILDSVKLQKSNMTISFIDSFLKDVNFSNSSIGYIGFDKSILQKLDFKDTNISNVKFAYDLLFDVSFPIEFKNKNLDMSIVCKNKKCKIKDKKTYDEIILKLAPSICQSKYKLRLIKDYFRDKVDFIEFKKNEAININLYLDVKRKCE